MNEFLARYEVFKRNVISTFKEENSSYKQGITKFSDLTQQEFKKIYLNLDYNALAFANFVPYIFNSKNSAPNSWDWREQGYVPPVKDQGSCGSCWAFVTIEILESMYYKVKNVYVPFSVQLLIDCDTYDSGCNGGLMENAFTWLKQNGIMKEQDYPYTGKKGTCRKDPSKYIDMKVTGYKKLGPSSSTWSPVDDELKEFLYETGILSAALNADPLQTYTGGILDVNSSLCPASGINHAVVIVGYGQAGGKDYWIVKNSWGKNWGESGYFRIKRGSGTCGINSYIIIPLVKFE